MTVAVPDSVYAGLEAVRESSETNMLEMATVQRLAAERGHHATVCWLEETDAATYFAAVMAGIEPASGAAEAVACERCGEPVEHADHAPARCPDCFEAAQCEGRR
jgi:formylmethanofuran dehydrogenase subunit E